MSQLEPIPQEMYKKDIEFFLRLLENPHLEKETIQLVNEALRYLLRAYLCPGIVVSKLND